MDFLASVFTDDGWEPMSEEIEPESRLNFMEARHVLGEAVLVGCADSRGREWVWWGVGNGGIAASQHAARQAAEQAARKKVFELI